MHVICLVRRGRKYHTDQSHRIMLTCYFFYLREGMAFWYLAPSSTMSYYATVNRSKYWSLRLSSYRSTKSSCEWQSAVTLDRLLSVFSFLLCLLTDLHVPGEVIYSLWADEATCTWAQFFSTARLVKTWRAVTFCHNFAFYWRSLKFFHLPARCSR